jgi:hypothetical protein
MRGLIDGFVIASGCGVLAAEIGMLLAMAYLRGGHPPASGIIVMLVLLIMGPVSAIAAIVGLSARARPLDNEAHAGRLLFVMTGVNLSFAVLALMVFVLKVVLGQSI